ncbi:MAG: glutamate synthase subunit alpha, partial [candidate division GAL15 bacterium]
IQDGGSDSAMLDNVLELVRRSGRDLPHAVRMLVPEAWEGAWNLDAAVRAFYRYHACLAEPWDGPAALAFFDGRTVGMALDRNGLRPARYTVTHEGLVVAGSEVGVLPIPPGRVLEKGRLGPGEMVVVDLEERRFLHHPEILQRLSRRRPYVKWVERLVRVEPKPKSCSPEERVDLLHLAFGYTKEDLQRV